MDFQEKLLNFIKKHEGIRSKVYKDSLGIPTIGVGFNLKRPDAKDIIESLGLDYLQILSGKQVLSLDQINFLLQKDLDECILDLKSLFNDWDQRPENFKLVLVDMRFQLGGAGLRGFKNTLKYLKTKDYKQAGVNMTKSLAYKQTPVRWKENIKLLEQIV